jgi:hypothetical protein
MSIWTWLAIAAGVVLLVPLGLGALVMAFPRDDSMSTRRDATGKVIVLDTPSGRERAAMAYDGSVAMERRGHQMSDGSTWNDRWLHTIRAVRSLGENPEWYVQYILTARRAAGLPELTPPQDLPDQDTAT